MTLVRNVSDILSNIPWPNETDMELNKFDCSLVGIPQILYYGDHEDGEERIMIMEMLGLNLDKIFIESNYHFSIEKIHWISKQLVSNISLSTFKSDSQCVRVY